jgi:hypothetical protein
MSKRITAQAYREMMGVSTRPPSATAKQQARGLKRNVRGEMNKTEIRYQQHLELEQFAGRVAWSAYEPMRLRLADSTFVCPDFAVMTSDSLLELHEVKGTTKGRPLITEAGLLRFKLARELYWMFRWRLVYLVDGAWREWPVGNGARKEAA